MGGLVFTSPASLPKSKKEIRAAFNLISPFFKNCLNLLFNMFRGLEKHLQLSTLDCPFYLWTSLVFLCSVGILFFYSFSFAELILMSLSACMCEVEPDPMKNMLIEFPAVSFVLEQTRNIHKACMNLYKIQMFSDAVVRLGIFWLDDGSKTIHISGNNTLNLNCDFLGVSDRWYESHVALQVGK